jgi:predicted Co/Zn/Cd cation transporter (cation efflux family)
MDLYVYYRVRVGDATPLQAQVATMQARLRREHGVATALKRRPDAKDGRHTWMEVYLAVPDGFDAALERAVEQSKLATLIDGERRAERFMDADSCA